MFNDFGRYRWGVLSHEQAFKILKQWDLPDERKLKMQAYQDGNSWQVKRDLGRPQGVNEVALALQVLINFKLVWWDLHRFQNLEKSNLLNISRMAILKNMHLLPHALEKIYSELLNNDTSKKAFLNFIATDIPKMFSPGYEQMVQGTIDKFLAEKNDNVQDHQKAPSSPRSLGSNEPTTENDSEATTESLSYSSSSSSGIDSATKKPTVDFVNKHTVNSYYSVPVEQTIIKGYAQRLM